MTVDYPVVVLDTETVGLKVAPDVIWEFAAVRLNQNGTRETSEFFIWHDEDAAAELPDRYRADHDARFDAVAALSTGTAAEKIADVLRPSSDGVKVRVVGAIPSFDLERIGALLDAWGYPREWHHRWRCAESMTLGRLGRDPGGLRECAEALGITVDPTRRHTAMGDVETTLAIWSLLTADAEAVTA